MEMLAKRQYGNLDIGKFFCALLVVGIHAQPLGDRLVGGGYFFTTLCRIAVPFFFVTSSYLFYDRKTPIRKYVLRLIKLDIAWTIVELPFIIYKFYVIGTGNGIEKTFHLIQGLLWGESYMGSWFIHASWMGMLVLYWLTEHLKERTVVLICLGFFILALVDTSYSFLIAGTRMGEFWQNIDYVILPSESFIMAVPYFYIGRRLSMSRNLMSGNKAVGLLMVSILLLFIESLAVREVSDVGLIVNPRFEQFLLLPPLTYLLVYALKTTECRLRKDVAVSLRQQSTLIFLLHQPLIMFTYKIIGQSMGMALFGLVAVESILIAMSIILASKEFKCLNYLY